MKKTLIVISQIITFTLFSLTNPLTANAIEIGDIISPEIAAKLNLTPNKVAVVDFFASWCASCSKEIPDLNKFHRQQDNQNAEMIGIGVDDELAVSIAYQQKLSIAFPVHNDTNQQIVEFFNPLGMPALYYIKNNKVIGKRIGAVDHIQQKIEQDLKDLAGQP